MIVFSVLNEKIIFVKGGGICFQKKQKALDLAISSIEKQFGKGLYYETGGENKSLYDNVPVL